MQGILFIATLFVKIKNGFQNTLHILFPRLFAKDVDVYHHNYIHLDYVTVTLTKTRSGGTLKIGNGINVHKKCKDVGILFCNGHVYGYAIFKQGYLVFGDFQRTNFGYGMFKNVPKHRVKESVSVICTYVHLTQEFINHEIALLDGGN